MPLPFVIENQRFIGKIIEYMYCSFLLHTTRGGKDNEKKSGTNLISCPYDLYDGERVYTRARIRRIGG